MSVPKSYIPQIHDGMWRGASILLISTHDRGASCRFVGKPGGELLLAVIIGVSLLALRLSISTMHKPLREMERGRNRLFAEKVVALQPGKQHQIIGG